MTWNYKYDIFGGYDCMTSAYVIYDEDKYICDIDTGINDESEEYEAIAKLIVDSVNKMLEERAK